MSKSWIRRLPSLRSWKLSNFKSVVDADISLAPLTLVVGANSAGKSTLLQSILLMAQAAGQRTPGTFPLNGTLVGLGTFAEAHSDFDACDSDLMTIAGSVSMPFPLRHPRMFYGRGEELQDGIGQEGDENLISWRVDLRSDPERPSGALVDTADVSLFRGNELIGKLDAFPRQGDEEAPPMLESQHSIFSDRYLMTEYLKDRTAGDDASDALRHWRLAGGPAVNKEYGAVSFESGIPVNGLIETDEVTWFLDLMKREAMEFGFFIDDSGSEESDLGGSRMEESEALEKLYSLLRGRCLRVVEARRNGVGVGLELNAPDSSLLHSLTERSDYSDTLYPQLRHRLEQDVDGSRVILVGRPGRGRGMRDVSAELPEYLSSSVLYLGPLREDPRVTYPHAIAGSTHMPLGRKGESTASFLLQNTSGRRSAPVGAGRPYRLPMGAPRFPMPAGGTESSLELAVNAWVSHFGLGDSLGVRDQARYGVGFTIDKRDLTSVGTGVSQVLPVLVLCLVAYPGQLILLEQPELHLNPALQQHLADFFLAMVRSGRQLLVETHSEYMVTRLRRRVAEDSSGDVRNLFNFVFAEQDDLRRTNFRVLDVGESGALDAEDWPAGFFDQAGSDVEAIMKVALARRRRPAN